MKTLFKVSSLVAMLASGTANAEVLNSYDVIGNSKNKVERIELDGCGDFTTAALQSRGKVNGKMQDALNLDMDLEANSRYSGSFYCVINAIINVPAGKKFAVDAGVISGSVSTRRGGSADLHFRYGLQQTGDSASKNFEFGENINDDIDAYMPISRPKFTKCSNRDQQVRLRAVINGNVRDMSSSGSTLRLFGTSAESTSWRWSWDKCNGGSPGGDASLGSLPSTLTSTRGSTLKLQFDKNNSAAGVVETYRYRSFYPSVGQNYSGTFVIFKEDNSVVIDSDSGNRYFGKYSPSRRQMIWYNINFGYGPTNVTWQY